MSGAGRRRRPPAVLDAAGRESVLNARSATPSPFRGSNRPRNRIDGHVRRESSSAAARSAKRTACRRRSECASSRSEISFVRFDDGRRYGDRGREARHPSLKVATTERVADRVVEVRVERADDRALGFVHREQRKQRSERASGRGRCRTRRVEALRAPVVCSARPTVMRASEPLPYTGTLCPTRITSGESSRTREIRRDDVDVMAAKPRLTREKMNVLADAAEVRIVVLGDLGDS